MVINPYSSSSIREGVLHLAKTQLEDAHADVKSRNDHIQAAKEAYKAGDLDAAKQEQQAALAAEQNVLADRSTLLDFHKNVGVLRGDISQRNQDFQTFKADMQSGDIEGAKAAFKAFHEDQKIILSDLQGLGLNGQPTANPVDVSA